MNNLEKMKQDVISQIEKMDAKTFEKFTELLKGNYNTSTKVIDLSGIFQCKDCRKKYGDCPDLEDKCSERFEQYAMIDNSLI